jgi:hypothetical protein
MAQTGYTPIQIYSSSTGGNMPSAGSLLNNTLGSELAINITDGKLFYKDNGGTVQVIGWKVVPTTAGGTGLTSYTAGDTVYYASGTTLSKLAIGASKTIMTSTGSAPQWSASLDTTQGGTGVTSYSAGDLPYYASGSALSKLGIGTANYVLTSSGTAPQWSAQSGLSVGTASNLKSNATTGVMQIVGPAAASTRVMTIPDANFTVARTDTSQTFTGDQTFSNKVYTGDAFATATADVNGYNWGIVPNNEAYGDFCFRRSNAKQGNPTSGATSTRIVQMTASGVNVNGTITPTDNIVQGTAAKGINFTANTPASGMTSQLLNWYEEGTWTPTLSDGTNNATMSQANGSYIRVGNIVTVWAWIETSSLGSVTGNIQVKGLPFTVKNSNSAYGSAGVVGNAYNLNITAGQNVTVRANPNATTINIYLWNAATGASNMQASQWSAIGGAQFSCSYQTT